MSLIDETLIFGAINMAAVKEVTIDFSGCKNWVEIHELIKAG